MKVLLVFVLLLAGCGEWDHHSSAKSKFVCIDGIRRHRTSSKDGPEYPIVVDHLGVPIRCHE